MFKPTKGWLGQKVIRHLPNGDPNFTDLGDCQNSFTNEEIVYLVNRQLYALDYQRETHKKRAQAERDLLAPVKLKAKEMFGMSYLKLTEAQIEQAIEAVKKDQEEKEE